MSQTTESVPEPRATRPPTSSSTSPVEDILDGDDNTRPVVIDDDLRALGESMKAIGQQQPITVYRDGDKYRVIAGHRRLGAAPLVGMTTLKAALITKPAGGRLHLGRMAENRARRNLTPAEDVAAVEKARAENPGMTNREISAHTGYSEREVSICLTVAGCPVARAALAGGKVTSLNEAYAVAKDPPDRKPWRLGLKAAGASSHAVAAAKPESEPAEPPAADKPRVKRVAIPLPKGHTVVAVTGEVASLDGLINVLTEALELARTAHRQALSMATAQRAWGDRARAGKPAKKGA